MYLKDIYYRAIYYIILKSRMKQSDKVSNNKAIIVRSHNRGSRGDYLIKKLTKNRIDLYEKDCCSLMRPSELNR